MIYNVDGGNDLSSETLGIMNILTLAKQRCLDPKERHHTEFAPTMGAGRVVGTSTRGAPVLDGAATT